MTLFVYSHICFPIDVHFVTAVAVMVMSISDVLFPNVFGVDLYEHGYTDYSSADSHAHRRLHGSLAFISSNSTVVSLSDADVQNIVEHSAFYIQFIAASCGFMYYLLKVVGLIKNGNSGKMTAAYAVGLFGMVAAATRMSITITLGDDSWLESPDTFVQRALVMLNDYTGYPLWNWIAQLLFRIGVPPSLGLEVTIRLSKLKDDDSPTEHYATANDDGGGDSVTCRGVSVVTILGGAFRLLALACLGVYGFVSSDADSNVALPHASGFRTKPFTYVFMPIWMVAVILITTALVLHAARLQLESDTPAWKELNLFTSTMLAVALLCSSWVIIPKFEYTWVAAGFVMVLLPARLLAVPNTWPPPPQHAAFIVAMVALEVGAVVSKYANIFLVLLMVMFDLLVPSTVARRLDITFTALSPPGSIPKEAVDATLNAKRGLDYASALLLRSPRMFGFILFALIGVLLSTGTDQAVDSVKPWHYFVWTICTLIGFPVLAAGIMTARAKLWEAQPELLRFNKVVIIPLGVMMILLHINFMQKRFRSDPGVSGGSPSALGLCCLGQASFMLFMTAYIREGLDALRGSETQQARTFDRVRALLMISFGVVFLTWVLRFVFVVILRDPGALIASSGPLTDDDL